MIDALGFATMFLDSFTMPQSDVERQARTSALVGSDSARGQLITVLGEFVLPHGESAWTQTLIDAMELLGVLPKTTRQVLARLAERGWLTRTRDGRRTRWHLTTTSRELLRDGARRIYGFGHTQPVWDGRWLVLFASLPEREEHQRYRLTTELTWAGFGSLGQGTWISPWNDHEHEAVRLATDLGLTNVTTFLAEVGRLGSGSELAARAWDLDAIRTRYDDFVDATPPIPTGRALDDGPRCVAALVGLVHRWRRLPFLDPDLPDELLPDDWPASTAADLFAENRAQFVGGASAWWASTESTYGPSAPDRPPEAQAIDGTDDN